MARGVMGKRCPTSQLSPIHSLDDTLTSTTGFPGARHWDTVNGKKVAAPDFMASMLYNCHQLEEDLEILGIQTEVRDTVSCTRRDSAGFCQWRKGILNMLVHRLRQKPDSTPTGESPQYKVFLEAIPPHHNKTKDTTFF